VDGRLQITAIQNQKFSKPFEAGGSPTIYTLQCPFMLTEAEFHVLRADTTTLDSLAINLAASLVVLLVTAALRWVYALKTKVDSGLGYVDVVAMIAIGVATAVLFGISRKWPGRRGRLISEIETHFNENRPTFGSGKAHGRNG
jgi:hypothetical protein